MVGNIYDFHSHILPGMDDGYQTPQESVQALKMSYAQGVRQIIATPHFYADESIEEFLLRRQEAMYRLEKAMEEDGGPFPEICLGAEVAYYPDISRTEDLCKLCVGKSRFLLLELPFTRWGADVLRDMQYLCSCGTATPIIAHIERYWSLQSRQIFEKILSLQMRAQMNGACLLDWKRRGKAKKWLKNGWVQYVGSDCHNLTTRAPNLGAAISKLKASGAEDLLSALETNSADAWRKVTGE